MAKKIVYSEPKGYFNEDMKKAYKEAIKEKEQSKKAAAPKKGKK